MNNFLWEIPEHLKIYGHFKNIEVLLQKVDDIENLKFSFENEKIVKTKIMALRKNFNEESIRKILDRHGLYDIKVPRLFTCQYCGMEYDILYRTTNCIPGYDGVLCHNCSKTYFRKCSSCGKEVYQAESKLVQFKYYCTECFSSKYFSCSYCGNAYSKDIAYPITYNGNTFEYCYTHYEKVCKVCICCGQKIPYGFSSTVTLPSKQLGHMCYNCMEKLNPLYIPSEKDQKKIKDELGIWNGEEYEKIEAVADEWKDSNDEYYEEENDEYYDDEDEYDEEE